MFKHIDNKALVEFSLNNILASYPIGIVTS